MTSLRVAVTSLWDCNGVVMHLGTGTVLKKYIAYANQSLSLVDLATDELCQPWALAKAVLDHIAGTKHYPAGL